MSPCIESCLELRSPIVCRAEGAALNYSLLFEFIYHFKVFKYKMYGSQSGVAWTSQNKNILRRLYGRIYVFFMFECDIFYSWVCTDVYSKSHCVHLHQCWSMGRRKLNATSKLHFLNINFVYACSAINTYIQGAITSRPHRTCACRY